MFVLLVSGGLLTVIGALLVYLSGQVLKIFLPGHCNENKVIAAKLIGGGLVMLGALLIFIFGINQ